MLRGRKGFGCWYYLTGDCRKLSFIELSLDKTWWYFTPPPPRQTTAAFPRLFDEFDRSKRRQREKERIEVKIKLTLKQTWQRHRAQLHRASWLYHETVAQLDRLKMTWSSRWLTLGDGAHYFLYFQRLLFCLCCSSSTTWPRRLRVLILIDWASLLHCPLCFTNFTRLFFQDSSV